jgi:transposase
MLSRTIGVILLWSLPMPAARACQIVLAACDRPRLKHLERSQTAPWRQVLRAKIVLLAARGMPNARIAAWLGITVDTARKWRGRFATHGLAGLADRPRAGRPSRFTPLQVAEVKALACQLPAEQGVPLSRWSCPELAREAITPGITTAISASTVARWLAEDAIKPWQHRSWIFIRDPDFRTKAGCTHPPPRRADRAATAAVASERLTAKARRRLAEHQKHLAQYEPGLQLTVDEVAGEARVRGRLMSRWAPASLVPSRSSSSTTAWTRSPRRTPTTRQDASRPRLTGTSWETGSSACGCRRPLQTISTLKTGCGVISIGSANSWFCS